MLVIVISQVQIYEIFNKNHSLGTLKFFIVDQNAYLPSSLAFRGWSNDRQPHGRRASARWTTAV